MCYCLIHSPLFPTGIVRVGGVHSGTGICSYRYIVSGNLSSQLLASRSIATLLFHSSRFARLVACHREAASELFFEQQQTPTCVYFNALLLCPNDIMMIYQRVSRLFRHDNTGTDVCNQDTNDPGVYHLVGWLKDCNLSFSFWARQLCEARYQPLCTCCHTWQPGLGMSMC